MNARLNRALPLAALLFSFSPALLPAEDSAAGSLVEIEWENGVRHIAICAGKENWFLAVLPADMRPGQARPPRLRSGNQRRRTEFLHISEFYRLCLLEVRRSPGHIEPATIALRAQAGPGIFLRSLSSGAEYRGRVAGRDIEYQGEWLPCPLLRVRLEEEGHSLCPPGTPLVNESGEVVGLLTDRVLNARGETHAIPAPVIRKILWEMEHLQRSGPVWMGFFCHPQSTTPEVMEVSRSSPAARAGMKAGDVIVAVNDSEVETFRDLLGAVHCLPAANAATFRVLRGIEEIELEIEPQLADDRREARVSNKATE